MGTLKRLGGRGGSVAKKRHSRRWLRLMLLGRAMQGDFATRGAAICFARLSRNYSRIARMPDSILRGCARLTVFIISRDSS
jgi:hypothetical protein